MSPQAAARYMRVVGLFSIIISVPFAFAGVGDFTGANDVFFGLVSSGTEGVAGFNTLEAKLAVAIAGGLFGGLMAMYLFISAPGVEQGNSLIRKGTIYTFLTWFAIDSAASVASGNAPNVIANLGFLIILLAPVFLVKPAAGTNA